MAIFPDSSVPGIGYFCIWLLLGCPVFFWVQTFTRILFFCFKTLTSSSYLPFPDEFIHPPHPFYPVVGNPHFFAMTVWKGEGKFVRTLETDICQIHSDDLFIHPIVVTKLVVLNAEVFVPADFTEKFVDGFDTSSSSSFSSFLLFSSQFTFHRSMFMLKC